MISILAPSKVDTHVCYGQIYTHIPFLRGSKVIHRDQDIFQRGHCKGYRYNVDFSSQNVEILIFCTRQLSYNIIRVTFSLLLLHAFYPILIFCDNLCYINNWTSCVLVFMMIIPLSIWIQSCKVIIHKRSLDLLH